MSLKLHQRFYELCNRVAPGHEPEVWATWNYLVDQYSGPNRYYHTLAHVEDCLKKFDWVSPLAHETDEVEMAIFFHDAEDTPSLSVDRLDKLNFLPKDFKFHTGSIVISTNHEKFPTEYGFCFDSQRLIADIDLSILGSDRVLFDAYDRLIACEYSYVPVEKYLMGRRGVLTQFLERDKIYHTDYFYNLYEDTARDNLNRAITRLDETISWYQKSFSFKKIIDEYEYDDDTSMVCANLLS